MRGLGIKTGGTPKGKGIPVAGSKSNYLRDPKEIINTRIKNKLFTGSKTNYLAWGCQNAVFYIILGKQRAHFTAPAVK